MADNEPPNPGIEILEEESFNLDKYDRQKRIPGWDQDKISNAIVMVIGAGATGNELVKNLVLTGVGKIYLIDYDTIEFSNLNRCVLFNINESTEGKYKADVVKDASRILNPDVNVISIKEELNSIDKNLYTECDVICSCVDNIEARIESNNYAFYHGIPFVDSGIDEYFGTVQAVYSGMENTACLQCGITKQDLDLMWKKFSCTGQELKPEDSETTRKIATIITTTSIIGGLQSQQVYKFILGLDNFKNHGTWNPRVGEPLVGKQLLYNGLTNNFRVINKMKDKDCWICSYSSPKSKMK